MIHSRIKIDHPQLRPAHKMQRFATLRTVSALILREMASTYGRTPGGYLWAILEPVGGIVAITLMFSVFLYKPPLGNNFAIFYATGLVPFLMFLNINAKLTTALTSSKQLLAYPRVTIADALLAQIILQALTQLAVSVLVLGGILFLFDTGTTFLMSKILLAHVLVICLAIGWGILNCLLVSVLPVWRSIWSILTRPLMILSGVLFIYSAIPQPFRDWLWFNPLIHVIGLMRAGFYPNYDASYVSIGYVMFLSLTPGVIGLLFLRRYYRNFNL